MNFADATLERRREAINAWRSEAERKALVDLAEGKASASAFRSTFNKIRSGFNKAQAELLALHDAEQEAEQAEVARRDEAERIRAEGGEPPL